MSFQPEFGMELGLRKNHTSLKVRKFCCISLSSSNFTFCILLGIFIMILYHSRYYHFQTLIVCVVSSVTGLGLKGPTTGCAEEFRLPCCPVHVLNVSLHVLHSFVHASCFPCKTVHALKALHRWKQFVAAYIPEGELLPHAMD